MTFAFGVDRLIDQHAVFRGPAIRFRGIGELPAVQVLAVEEGNKEKGQRA